MSRAPISISNREVLWVDQDEIAVIIPCFNEAQTIGKVVDDFHRELPEATVYVYDNASTDATAAIAMKHGATVRYEPRRGKGNVCRQMFRDIDVACYLNRCAGRRSGSGPPHRGTPAGTARCRRRG